MNVVHAVALAVISGLWFVSVVLALASYYIARREAKGEGLYITWRGFQWRKIR